MYVVYLLGRPFVSSSCLPRRYLPCRRIRSRRSSRARFPLARVSTRCFVRWRSCSQPASVRLAHGTLYLWCYAHCHGWYAARGDKKRAQARLRSGAIHKSHHFSTFRSGLLLGLGVPALADGLYRSAHHGCIAICVLADGMQVSSRRRGRRYRPGTACYSSTVSLLCLSSSPASSVSICLSGTTHA